MKKLLFLLFLPSLAFAISCPNTGAMITLGATTADVIKTCGEPVSNTTREDNIPVSFQLTYFRDNGSTNHTRYTFLFTNNRLVNIHISTPNPAICNTTTTSYNPVYGVAQVTQSACGNQEEDVTNTGVCGQYIQTGYSSNFIKSVCGTPDLENVVQTKVAKVTELVYSGVEPHTLQFENDSLIGWK